MWFLVGFGVVWYVLGFRVQGRTCIRITKTSATSEGLSAPSYVTSWAHIWEALGGPSS